MKKHVKIFISVIIIFLVIFLFFAFLLLIDVLHGMKDFGWAITCEKTLTAIGQAVEVYKSDHEGSLPSSLSVLKDYIKEKRPSDSAGIPICVGNTDDEAGNTPYYVYKPYLSTNENRPICWDSKPHRIRGRFLADRYVWNVLYADGHVERLNRRKFMSLMSSLGISDPNNLSNKSTRP
ncbi:MAG: hypothetical protein GY774_35900 [Planctomycetes bacterium]|nr:hypothetical protein [Planctomycetota bacterium]